MHDNTHTHTSMQSKVLQHFEDQHPVLPRASSTGAIAAVGIVDAATAAGVDATAAVLPVFTITTNMLEHAFFENTMSGQSLRVARRTTRRRAAPRARRRLGVGGGCPRPRAPRGRARAAHGERGPMPAEATIPMPAGHAVL